MSRSLWSSCSARFLDDVEDDIANAEDALDADDGGPPQTISNTSLIPRQKVNGERKWILHIRRRLAQEGPIKKEFC